MNTKTFCIEDERFFVANCIASYIQSPAKGIGRVGHPLAKDSELIVTSDDPFSTVITAIDTLVGDLKALKQEIECC